MIAEVLAELEKDIAKAHEALKRELAKIRTGRAHPSLLESVRVEVYGSQMPISQLATVAVPHATRAQPAHKVDRIGMLFAEQASDLARPPHLRAPSPRCPAKETTQNRRAPRRQTPLGTATAPLRPRTDPGYASPLPMWQSAIV